MATLTPSYSATAALTITIASLASDTNLVAGREATARDNTSDLFDDVLLSGRITTGTSPTTARRIEVWVIGAMDDAGVWPDVFDGTDSNETATSRAILFGYAKRAAIITTSNTSDQGYWFGPVSVSALFGGVMPTDWTVFVVHNTGVNLNATSGNHYINYTGVKYASA